MPRDLDEEDIRKLAPAVVAEALEASSLPPQQATPTVSSPEPVTHEDRWAALEAAKKALLDRQIETGRISREESVYLQRRFDNENLVRETVELQQRERSKDGPQPETKETGSTTEHTASDSTADSYAPTSSRKAEAQAAQDSDTSTEMSDAKIERLARLREFKTSTAERAALKHEHARGVSGPGRGL